MNNNILEKNIKLINEKYLYNNDIYINYNSNEEVIYNENLQFDKDCHANITCKKDTSNIGEIETPIECYTIYINNNNNDMLSYIQFNISEYNYEQKSFIILIISFSCTHKEHRGKKLNDYLRLLLCKYAIEFNVDFICADTNNISFGINLKNYFFYNTEFIFYGVYSTFIPISEKGINYILSLIPNEGKIKFSNRRRINDYSLIEVFDELNENIYLEFFSENIKNIILNHINQFKFKINNLLINYIPLNINNKNEHINTISSEIPNESYVIFNNGQEDFLIIKTINTHNILYYQKNIISYLKGGNKKNYKKLYLKYKLKYLKYKKN